MAELRTDWLTGRSVLIAENRALRPNEFVGGSLPGTISPPAQAGSLSLPNCPFCLGNERRTPPAVYQQPDDESCWRVRVVPNMFPAVDNFDLSGSRPAAEAASPGGDVQQVRSAIGAHEVIIESPRHVDRMAALSVEEVRDILETYVQRLRHWRENARLRYGLVFKNQGPCAGASLGHLHSQLIAFPFIPPLVEAELLRAKQVFQQEKRCAYCGLIDQERSAGKRIVFDRDGFVAFCPFASWQPHEVWLMPAGHEPSFEPMLASVLGRLAGVLHELFARLESVAAQADYNLLVRTAPWRGDYDDTYHWRIELLPRPNALAGLEVATGVHINPLPPERAAQELRLS